MARKLKIRKGDNVVVTTGKDSGKTGEVLVVFPDTLRVLVRGVNIVKRHTKPSQTTTGGIMEREASIHISNVSFQNRMENIIVELFYGCFPWFNCTICIGNIRQFAIVL